MDKDIADISITSKYGHSFLVPSLKEPIALQIFTNGIYESMTEKFLCSRLKPGSAFVDIGANIGFFTVAFAKKIGSAGRVFAIEASPYLFPYLEHNIKNNGMNGNVSLYFGAAYEQNHESLPFYEAPKKKFGMGSLSARFGEKPVSIQARKLDDLLIQENITSVDVMKVDVEGWEWEVFKGAERLLSQENAPIIVFEFCDWAEMDAPHRRAGDAQRYLLNKGYQLWRLKDFLSGKKPLCKEISSGSDMLVALKRSGSCL